MSNRIKTKYPGVYYRNAKRIGGKGPEKVFYIVFKKNGKMIEEKVGRQYADDMTPAKASGIRSGRIEGKRLSRKKIRQQEEAAKKAKGNRWPIDRLWEEYKKQNPQLKGMHTYQSIYNLHIKPNFFGIEPKDILPLDIKRVKNRLLKKRSPQTVQHVLEQIRRIISFGVKNKLCPGIDFKFEMPKVDNIKTEDLTSKQLQGLLTAIDDDHHPHAGPMMKMALFTGMRRGELFRLKWSDIDYDRRFIYIRNPKGGEDQKIPLNDGTIDLLKTVQRADVSPFVFPGRNGGQRTNIRHQVNRIKKAAGLPKDFRPLHGLRHVYASMLAFSGNVDMYTLQKLLTHSDPQMTQRYAHLRDETLKSASDLAGEIIGEAMKAADDKNIIEMKGEK